MSSAYLCECMRLVFKQETHTAIMPCKGTRKSAGFDLYLDEAIEIEPQSTGIVSTGISIKFPRGYYGKIEARSSAALEHNIIILAGVIDEDYTGIIKICIYNASKDKKLRLCYSDCIAQLIVQPYYSHTRWLFVDKPKSGQKRVLGTPYLPKFGDRFKKSTMREKGGFGSTNVAAVKQSTKEQYFCDLDNNEEKKKSIISLCDSSDDDNDDNH